VLSGEATNANFIVFCHTRQKFEPTFYRTRSEQSNHYTTDVVGKKYDGGKITCSCLSFYFFICNIYLISTRCFNKGGDVGIPEEIHLRGTHGQCLLQIPFMFKNKTSFVDTNLKCSYTNLPVV